MKNRLIVLALCVISVTATAQKAQPADSNATLKGLPVLRSYVEPDVVERAKKKYGRSLYCIEKTTGENCQNSYLVGLLQNRRLIREWMCDDPKMVFQVPSTPAMVSVSRF